MYWYTMKKNNILNFSPEKLGKCWGNAALYIVPQALS